MEQEDWTCLCDVTVTNGQVYSEHPATVADIRDKLKIGSLPPDDSYDPGITITLDGENVVVYHKTSPGGYTADSIFKLQDETDEFVDWGTAYGAGSLPPIVGFVYLKNFKSEIQIGDATNLYYTPPARKPLIMRNPVMFTDLVQPEIRDAHEEIDAHIHHLTSHPTAPPFITTQLIQHFGISNPSPGFIRRVATVYKEGQYISNGETFGDGRFSSLPAVIAAILLDPEATSNTLDADPAYGGIKEPIVKVLSFMRAMGYRQTPHDRMFLPKLSNMASKVGQMAHESPDQFGFFLNDYGPPGQFAQSRLSAGAAQILTMSTTVSTIEGFFGLARNGLRGSDNGFGVNHWSGQPNVGDNSGSVGYLGYTESDPDSTSTEITENVADMLTAGRLSSDAVTQIAAKVDTMEDNDTKLRLAQQLVSTSPEFHTTNIVDRTANARAPTPRQERSEEDGYKAVVVVFLSGGWDAYNVLMPHTSCDLYPSYRKNREELALGDSQMLPITSDSEDQPCTTFGVHNKIPILKEIYDDGFGQFHANIGHLHKPVTKSNWFTETRTHLFSHTTMER